MKTAATLSPESAKVQRHLTEHFDLTDPFKRLLADSVVQNHDLTVKAQALMDKIGPAVPLMQFMTEVEGLRTRHLNRLFKLSKVRKQPRFRNNTGGTNGIDNND